jgi:acetyl esterase/lipase
VTVSNDTLSLPGTLLMPDTSAAVPGVVLVHGSGRLDRNGQGPQARFPPVYKRWAERMSRRGIAVLRYDKRTTRPAVLRADPQAVTFRDFVDDAVAAGRLLRNRSDVDPTRLVYVGHSQGGNVASAAATRLGDAAGVAALAAPALAVDSLIVAQLRANPQISDSLAQAVRAQFDSLRTGPPPTDGHIEIGPNRTGTRYWRQWIRHSQMADSVAAVLSPPLFVQQGRADANYPDETLSHNINAWRHIANRDNTTLRTYDGVTHRFLDAGTSTTADAPLDDLISWIRNRDG